MKIKIILANEIALNLSKTIDRNSYHNSQDYFKPKLINSASQELSDSHMYEGRGKTRFLRSENKLPNKNRYLLLKRYSDDKSEKN